MFRTAGAISVLCLSTALIGPEIVRAIGAWFQKKGDSGYTPDPSPAGSGDPGDPGAAHDAPISASAADRITNRHSVPAYPSNTSLNSAVKIRQETLPGGHTTFPRCVPVSDTSPSSAVKFPQEAVPGVLDEPIRASGGQVTVRWPVPAYPSPKTAVKIQPGALPAGLDVPMSAFGAHTSTLPLTAFTSDSSPNSAVKIESGALPKVLDVPISSSRGRTTAPLPVPDFSLDPFTDSTVKKQHPSVVHVPISSFGGRRRIRNSAVESLSKSYRNSALEKPPVTLPEVLDVRITALGGKSTNFHPAPVFISDPSPNSDIRIPLGAVHGVLDVPSSVTDRYISVRRAISDLPPNSVLGNLQDHPPVLKASIPPSHGRRTASKGFKSTADPLPSVKGPLPERRIRHYLSSQLILLVGEGDFSFSNALAKAFGSARNMVPTSLDSEETVLRQYKAASQILCDLKKTGAQVLHGVDATRMATHAILGAKSFDCIVYNFPHAGFHGSEDDKRVIRRHKRLVKAFFLNAAKLLRRNGEIHVSHKVKEPYSKWNLEEQAAMSGLMLKECSKFDRKHYPGYVNRRGAEPNWAQTFHLGECKTFKFILSPLLEGPPRPLPIKGFLQNGGVEGGDSQCVQKTTYKIKPRLG